jgi:predicted acyl esterase
MNSECVGNIEVLFRKTMPADQFPGYLGLTERTYVLHKGHMERPGAMPFVCDVLVEQDVPVKMRDGVIIRTDVYRPVTGGNCPSIIGWSPYGKRGAFLNMDRFGHPSRMDVDLAWEDGLNKFEAPNPSYWVAHGYAVIAPDARGTFNSEGDIRPWGPQEPMDEYDLIEWVGTRDWSNGKVGLTGNSWLAMSQWFVAPLRPPHLAAIAPWEGASDIYRNNSCRGGIPELIFTGLIFGGFCGNGRTEDVAAMTCAYPLFNEYWQSKVADHPKTEVPAYIVASWTNLLHTCGTLEGWRSIGSPEKWLRIHNTHEWTDYYNPVNVEDLRRFFDHYLKGTDNGWEATPRVRLTVLDPGNQDTVYRAEQDFPLSRQQFVPFYLGHSESGGCLTTTPVPIEATCVHEGSDPRGSTFRITFNKDTEITGYIKLKLWVEARGNDDMDIFVFVRKIDRNGVEQQAPVVTDRTHIGPNGRLRVSLRATDPERSTESEPYMLFNREEKLKPGEIVPIEIGFWPYSMRWRAGETLELVINGVDLLVRPEFPQLPPNATLNKGEHALHIGGRFDSHLLVPLIPG